MHCKLVLRDLIAQGSLRCQTCIVPTQGLFDGHRTKQAFKQIAAAAAAIYPAGAKQVMMLTCCLVSSGEPELSMTMSASCCFLLSGICAATFSMARSALMPSLFIKRFTCSQNDGTFLEAMMLIGSSSSEASSLEGAGLPDCLLHNAAFTAAKENELVAA